jgi:hypothetical protein
MIPSMVFNDEAIDPLQHPDAITNTLLIIQGITMFEVLSGCPSNGFVSSDKIPVSACPINR